jgi:hypothetical protein
LVVALFVLVVTLRALWPSGHVSWMDAAGIGTLALSTLGVGFWTVGAWMSDV